MKTLCLLLIVLLLNWVGFSTQLYADETPAPVHATSQYSTANYRVQLLGQIENRALTEASGIAQSTLNKNVFWSHNDAGHGPQLYAFSDSGEDLGRYHVNQASSRDWEDIAAFRWNNKSWLAVADTGDNNARKAISQIHLVQEPEVVIGDAPRLRPLTLAWSIRFSYPQGPADVEAVSVDPIEERVYLLTKRVYPPRLYSVPLQPDPAQKPGTVVMATLEGVVRSIPKPGAQEIFEHPLLGLYRSQPTSMDFSADGTFAVVGTYGFTWRFNRAAGQSWCDALNNVPVRIQVPVMKQSEAIAVGTNNQDLYITSEGRRPPVYKVSPMSPPSIPEAGAKPHNMAKDNQ